KPKLSAHEFEIFLTAEELQWADDFIAQHALGSRQRLGIHVGSGGTKNLRLKRWPFAGYRELLVRLRQSHPELVVLLFGGPEEQREHEQILAESKGASILAPPTRNLRQAAALLRQCHSFLSVDTAL